MATLDYFYDGQFRRLLLHFGRLFSWIHINVGKDSEGNDVLKKIPCRFASSDRMTQHIMRNNSENVMQAVPFMTFSINSIDIARARTRNSSDVRDLQIAERKYNPEQGAYTGDLGNTYHVQRMNPSPVDVEFSVDLWTTMLDHKLQVIEQIRPVFNPSIVLQSDTNPINWIAMQDVELTNINYSSKSMPVGTDDAIDITTFTFKVETWLSPPAKIQRQTLIENIINNIGEGSDEEDMVTWSIADMNMSTYTPGNYYINVSEDYSTLTVLDAYGKTTSTTWSDLFNNYGTHEDGVSQIRIRALVDDIEDSSKDIVGTVALDPNNSAQLTWTVDTDTLPTTSLVPVDGVINPTTSYPGQNLIAAATGQRYLLTQDVGSDGNTTVAWGNLVAKIDDIIEYDGANWFISFDDSTNTASQVVGSLAGNKRYQWTDADGWIDPIAGTFRSGWWKLVLND